VRVDDVASDVWQALPVRAGGVALDALILRLRRRGGFSELDTASLRLHRALVHPGQVDMTMLPGFSGDG